MRKSKYVVGLIMNDGIESRRLEAIVFSNSLTHKMAGEAMFMDHDFILSAGFINIDSDASIIKSEVEGRKDYARSELKVWVSGESESLGIGPHELDLKYVRRALGLDQLEMSKEERLADNDIAYEVIRARGRKFSSPPKRVKGLLPESVIVESAAASKAALMRKRYGK